LYWVKFILPHRSIAEILAVAYRKSDNRLGIGKITAKLMTEIQIEAGKLRGLRSESGVLVYKGIPYAAPPIGQNRWRSPQPAQPWSGTLNASEFGPRACQFLKIPGGRKQSEDCLTLNIWTNAQNADEKRPVMVWIHGGGFLVGSGGEAASDGTQLAKQGVVVRRRMI